MYSITKVFMNAWRIVNRQQRNVWKTYSSSGCVCVCRMCDRGYIRYMMFVVDGCSILHLHRSSVIAQLCWPGTTAMGSHRKWFQLHTAAKFHTLFDCIDTHRPPEHHQKMSFQCCREKKRSIFVSLYSFRTSNRTLYIFIGRSPFWGWLVALR